MSTDVAVAEAATPRTIGGKFLTFFLAEEEYGIEILKVQEIIGIMNITTVPRTPSFIRGVINLRGKVIPIVDLRQKFDMASIEQTDETCIIVVQAQGMEMGLVVDRVSEVMNIASEDIDDAPSFGSEVDTSYLLGVAKAEGQVKLLLDIDKVLSGHELLSLSTTASASTGEPQDVADTLVSEPNES